MFAHDRRFACQPHLARDLPADEMVDRVAEGSLY